MHVGVAEQLVDDGLDHPVQQCLPAGYVPVQRHALDPEVGAQTLHRQHPQAVLVDEPHRGVQDAPFVQTAAALARSAGRDGRYLGVVHRVSRAGRPSATGQASHKSSHHVDRE
jgi:hypothetical protein